MSIIKVVIILISTLYIFGCVEKTTYSGKIITEKDLNLEIFNKKELFEKFGQPSYSDLLLNKYFYFTEKRNYKNFFDNDIEYSYLFVFEINKDDNIINSEMINLLLDNNHKYKKEQTKNNIIKRGLIEKVFGGIGPNQLPNSP